MRITRIVTGKAKIASAFICILMVTHAHASEYGNRIASLPINTAKKLAEANIPNAVGAIGRNQSAYFHVRFQRGMHHVADYALVSGQAFVVDRFLAAVEYSMNNQLPTGDFKLVIPDSLKDQGKPGIADRASGVAFFVSSLGLGIHALETNDWFKNSAKFTEHRQRLAKLKPKLQLTLDYLLKHKAYLEAADKHAPNRLLFDALAFETLGRILMNNEAILVASSFVAMAIEQVNEHDGYFIEGGGFDSSYNAVAVALTLRLLMIDHHETGLRSICVNAIRWQKSRILASGEVLTEGNTRVHPGRSGESFLGRKKDVDIGHVVEAFMLASQALSDTDSYSTAQKVISYYESRR